MSKLFFYSLLMSLGVVWLTASAAPLTIPANDFSDIGTAKPGDDHLIIREPTEVTVAIRVPVPGRHKLVITARGENALGEDARLRVSVDGLNVGEFNTVSGPVWRTHTLPIELGEGERLISLRYLNDYFNAEQGEDRNAYVHSITLIQEEDVPGLESETKKTYQTVQEKRRTQVLEEAVRMARKVRLGGVVVQVLDEDGAPVDQASVTLETVNPAFKLGTALATAAFDPDNPMNGHVAYKALAENLFNEVVPEAAMKWPSMEPTDGAVETAALDAMVRWAQEKNKSIRGHCIFWACPERVQPWVQAMEDDVLFVRVEQRIKDLLEKYPEVKEYDVNNEMLHCSFYQERLGPDIRSRMFKLSHQAAPDARLFVNDFNILNGLKSDAYMEQIQNLLASGAPIGGIGVQAHFQDDIDITTVRQVLDQLAIFNLPIKLTELDVQVKDEDLQARLLEDVMRVAYGHPSVEGILLWGFWENAHWQPNAALYRKNFDPKPAGLVLERLAAEWRTAYVKDTGPEGLVDDYLAFGECRVSVKAKGYNKKTVKFDLVPKEDGDPERVNVVLTKN